MHVHDHLAELCGPLVQRLQPVLQALETLLLHQTGVVWQQHLGLGWFDDPSCAHEAVHEEDGLVAGRVCEKPNIDASAAAVCSDLLRTCQEGLLLLHERLQEGGENGRQIGLFLRCRRQRRCADVQNHAEHLQEFLQRGRGLQIQ
eukprot:scaffold1509_cov240-Pinguiococcus_pyrenoidosus.AAC.38